MFQNVGT